MDESFSELLEIMRIERLRITRLSREIIEKTNGARRATDLYIQGDEGGGGGKKKNPTPTPESNPVPASG